MPGPLDVFDDINSQITTIGSLVQVLTAQMTTTAGKAQDAITKADTLVQSVAKVESGPSGFTGVTNELSDVKRRLTSLGHDIEIALSPLFFSRFAQSRIPKPAPVTQSVLGLTVLSMASAGQPSFTFDPGGGDSCRVLGKDEVGVGMPVTLSSDVFKHNAQTGTIWLSLALGLNDQKKVTATMAHGPRLCGVDDVLDKIDPFFYDSQISGQPITHKTPLPGDPPEAVCDPTTPSCRHVRTLIDQLVTGKVQEGITQPFDIPTVAGSLSQPPLNLNVDLYDIQVASQVSICGRISNIPQRPRSPFSPLGILSSWNVGVKIHKSILDSRIADLVKQIQDANGVDASLESTTFDTASQTIVMIVDGTKSDKEKFSFGIASVTMRVTVNQRLQFRITPEVVGTHLVLHVLEEKTLDQSESHSFEPDIVNDLTGPMKDFINSIIGFVAGLRDKIERDATLPSDNDVTAIGYRIEADRLIVFMDRKDAP